MSGVHIPDTAEVRDYWMNSQYPETYAGSDVRAGEAFDVWLAEVERMAALSALKKMAYRWQWCDWPVMAEAGRGSTVIGQAQRVTDWMRSYIEKFEAGS